MDEEVLVSEGKCFFCKQTFSQKGMSRHLAKHLSDKEEYDGTTEFEILPYCHLQVDCGPYFLHLLIKESLSLKKLDDFLRHIWLECCGHLSAFTIKREEINQKLKIGNVFHPKLEVNYEYDFGDTTQLRIKALNSYQLNMDNQNIVLLSRNEPLKIMCDKCGKYPAVSICTICNWDEPSFFCEKCSKKHEKECDDFADGAELPVVNSPRVGVCGYVGGDIDKERDGVYKMKESDYAKSK